LARSLNCANGPTSEPCGTCQSCIELAPNGPGSIDVIELDAASNRGIDQARELRERAMYAPASSRFRIYIIDEAHQLTTEAANALLKLVEEPPEHLRFIFATTEPEKLLGTIRSRTHHYPFRLVPTNILQEHLAKVCAAEGVAADPAALALAAKAGAGSVRDALSVLGQLVGGAGPNGITYEEAVIQLGFTADTLIDRIVDALATDDGGTVFQVIDQVVTGGHDPRRFATDLLERLRDLIIMSAAPEAAEHGLIALPADRLEVLRAQAASLGAAALSRAADLVSDGLTALRGATAPRLHLELLGARLLVTATDADPATMVARLDAIEKKLLQGFASAPVVAAPEPARVKATPPPKLSSVAPATAAAEPAPVPAAAAVVEDKPAEPPVVEPVAVVAAPATAPVAVGGAVDLPAIQALWPAIIETVRTMPGGGRIAWVSASNGWPTAATAELLTISYNNLGPLNMAKSRDFDKLIAQAASTVIGRNFTVELAHVPDLVVPSADSTPTDLSPKPVAAAQVKPVVAPVIEPVAAPVVEEVAKLAPSFMDHVPAEDDPVSDAVSGIDLVADLLGGTVIDEYDEKTRKP